MNDQTNMEGTDEGAKRKHGKKVEKLNAQAKIGGIRVGPAIDPAITEYTVVMIGMPRGGTTMVAGVAQRLGLNIGENLGFNLEDEDFDRKTMAHMRAAAAARDGRMPVWGWKFPTASNYLEKLLPHLRNPRLVVVWRDPLTAAMRSVEQLMDQGLPEVAQTKRSLNAVETMVNRQMNNLSLLRTVNVPALLASYEKSLRRPQEFIEQFASFLGLPVPADTADILKFMEPESYK